LIYASFYTQRIPPIGNYLVSIYACICTYAVLRHEFLNIKVIIRKGLIYSALVSLMTLAYVLVIVVTESLLQNIFGYQSVLIKVLTAFSFGLFLIPLRNQIQKFVDHYFFKGSPEELSEKIEKYSAQAQESDKYKMAAKLAGNVAHEIKNPLTAINTFIQQFPEKKDDPEFVRKFHTLASSELERIKQLSYQLMDFAKPADIKLSTFNLHQTLDDVLLLTNERLKKNKITINTQFSNEPITLTGDKDQLKQVFLNLILNAADAMENGGNLTVTTAFVGANLRDLSPNGDRPVEGQTHRSAPTDNHNIQISISDTGCGISQDNLKKLFEPFFTTKKDGTGLGLSICKRIIETHGGKIDVESKINKGTSFLITLPHTHSEKSDV
jgi:signal transduction histidine kinase